MYIPRIKLLPSFLRELLLKKPIIREPEPSAAMEDPDQVSSYVEAGQHNALTATYLFMNAQISQVIQGRHRVIDLACGPATLLCEVAQANPSISFLGIDLSPTMLAQARQTAKKWGLSNINFQQGDITSLNSIADGTADGVISTLALHHLPTGRHLDACFREMKRILKPGGALFLADFGRLKSLLSVISMAYLTAGDEPHQFTLDKERSMRAAFTYLDFESRARKEWGDAVEVLGTYKVPLFIMARTPPHPLPDSMIRRFQDRRLALTPRHRQELDDIRFFFSLGGAGNDVFGSFMPAADQWAKLRAMDFAALPVLGAIHASRFRRTLAVFWLFLDTGWVYLRYKTLNILSPSQKKKNDNELIHRVAKILKQHLGTLKGPIMKFAQIASYITEDLPESIQAALAPLQDQSPPMAGSIIRSTVERELKRPIEQIFKEWHDTPFAVASISQVHLARLWNDRWVAVKVRYPGVLRAVNADFFLLRCSAPFLKRWWGVPNIMEVLNELELLMRTECDFSVAGAFQEEFRSHFRDDPEVIIPRVYLDHSSESVLTMDYVEGKTYREFKSSSTQAEKNRASEIIWRMAAESINRYGLYNADPHPGNYLFVDNRVAFLDFGFTKRFSGPFIHLWKQQSISGCAGDFDRFKKINQQLGYERKGRKMDHRALFDTYRTRVYRAWMEDRPFKFTKDYVRDQMRSLLALQRSSRGTQRLPVEFVSILRLLSGQQAILADLNAESNWHRIIFPLLSGLPPEINRKSTH